MTQAAPVQTKKRSLTANSIAAPAGYQTNRDVLRSRGRGQRAIRGDEIGDGWSDLGPRRKTRGGLFRSGKKERSDDSDSAG